MSVNKNEVVDYNFLKPENDKVFFDKMIKETRRDLAILRKEIEKKENYELIRISEFEKNIILLSRNNKIFYWQIKSVFQLKKENENKFTFFLNSNDSNLLWMEKFWLNVEEKEILELLRNNEDFSKMVKILFDQNIKNLKRWILNRILRNYQDDNNITNSDFWCKEDNSNKIELAINNLTRTWITDIEVDYSNDKIYIITPHEEYIPYKLTISSYEYYKWLRNIPNINKNIATFFLKILDYGINVFNSENEKEINNLYFLLNKNKWGIIEFNENSCTIKVNWIFIKREFSDLFFDSLKKQQIFDRISPL